MPQSFRNVPTISQAGPTPVMPGLTGVAGFRAAGLHCGVKTDPSRWDLALIASETPCAAAGVFTTNALAAAPVEVSREHLRQSRGQAQAIVANSGNANAATGPRGQRDAREMAAATGAALGLSPERVLVCSTGIIGVALPMPAIRAGITAAAAGLGASADHDLAAARGIMTTDAGPKLFGATAPIAGHPVTVAGIAKGAGMIAPNMATMLAFLTTDAAIPARVLQRCLGQAVTATFNTIRVDGHTSTNDTVLCLASGRAGHPPLRDPQAPDTRRFAQLLEHVCLGLALQILRDGEGADRLCQITVEGAATDRQARAVACAIADSPLWKCALTAGHPNWGRVVCAVGNVVTALDPDQLVVRLGPSTVFRKGQPVAVEADKLQAAMTADPVVVHVKLALGTGHALVRTCDINHKYITENTGRST